jgi:hypothetical protein
MSTMAQLWLIAQYFEKGETRCCCAHYFDIYLFTCCKVISNVTMFHSWLLTLSKCNTFGTHLKLSHRVSQLH